MDLNFPWFALQRVLKGNTNIFLAFLLLGTYKGMLSVSFPNSTLR